MDDLVRYVTSMIIDDEQVQEYVNRRVGQIYMPDPNNDDDQVYYRLFNNEIARIVSKVVLDLEQTNE